MLRNGRFLHLKQAKLSFFRLFSKIDLDRNVKLKTIKTLYQNKFDYYRMGHIDSLQSSVRFIFHPTLRETSNSLREY